MKYLKYFEETITDNGATLPGIKYKVGDYVKYIYNDAKIIYKIIGILKGYTTKEYNSQIYIIRIDNLKDENKISSAKNSDKYELLAAEYKLYTDIETEVYPNQDKYNL